MPSGRRITVLVVDDFDAVRVLLGRVVSADPRLELAGEAVNGREAIDLTERLRPDVVLLDVAMPVMDGLEALPHLRAVAPDTRVIILTGHDVPAVAELAGTGGASAFLNKTARMEDIVEAIVRVATGGGDHGM